MANANLNIHQVSEITIGSRKANSWQDITIELDDETTFTITLFSSEQIRVVRKD